MKYDIQLQKNAHSKSNLTDCAGVQQPPHHLHYPATN